MIRLIRAPFAAVLAFIEEWQPPIAPRRIMADAVVALNEYEELHETLPEPSPARFGSTWCATHHTTISTCYQEHQCDEQPERTWSQCFMHDHTEPVCAPCCYADNGYCDCECHPQSSPNPHGDLPSVPMPADGSAAEVSAAPPAPSAAPSTSQPHDCGERDDYWQGAPGDKHTCHVCGDTWTAEELGPLDIEWVRDEPAPALPNISDWVRATAVNVGLYPDVVSVSPTPAPSHPNFVDWATPAICDVLAEHHPDESKAGVVWCFDEPGSTGRLNSHGQYADWQDYREHVAPLIAQRLEAAGAHHKSSFTQT